MPQNVDIVGQQYIAINIVNVCPRPTPNMSVVWNCLLWTEESRNGGWWWLVVVDGMLQLQPEGKFSNLIFLYINDVDMQKYMLYINFFINFQNLRSTEVAGGQERLKNQLCRIELKIVSNDRYIILVYDNIIMLGVRG